MTEESAIVPACVWPHHTGTVHHTPVDEPDRPAAARGRSPDRAPRLDKRTGGSWKRRENVVTQMIYKKATSLIVIQD
jgi:hypothetical protein